MLFATWLLLNVCVWFFVGVDLLDVAKTLDARDLSK